MHNPPAHAVQTEEHVENEETNTIREEDPHPEGVLAGDAGHVPGGPDCRNEGQGGVNVLPRRGVV